VSVELFNAASLACIETSAKLKSAFSRLTKRMNRSAPTTVRRRFFAALGHAFHLTWPVLSAILAIQIALGLPIGIVEGWSVGDAVYFTFVTGLTIGYGDIVPRQALARVLAIGIGVSGLFLTGLIAGIAVYAMRTALTDHDTG
jgi:Ion channel